MSNFQEQLLADLNNTFLNLDEFAKEHELNGKKYICVVDEPTEQEKFQTGSEYGGFETVRGQTLDVYVKADDFSESPAEGETFTVDGEYCIVDSCVDDLGLLAITFHKNHM